MASVLSFRVARQPLTPGLAEPVAAAHAVGPLGAFDGLDSVRAARRAILKRIAESDTYLEHSLTEADSVLKRWPRQLEPLRVFIDQGDPELRRAVEQAFGRWERVGAIPVDFTFVREIGRAHV